MGVKGLQTFIENQCSDACKYVSIQQMAEEHRTNYQCQPVLAVDGMALINRLYSKTLEWIYGGQWIQFKRKLEEFIERFSAIGVKLVFFFDGTVCASKRKEWVRRRISKYQQVDTVFNEIGKNFCEPDNKLFLLPTSMGTLTRFALKELGAEVYQTDREADEVIAEFANKYYDVFAILSQDSDFIIYNTKNYLSLQHLDLDTLRTMHYDRCHFSNRYLRLQVDKLPLFACLGGNDIIPFEKLRRFHRYLSNNKMGRIFMSDIAENLADIINREGWTGDPNNNYELNDISKKICGNASLSKLIHSGLVSYLVGSDKCIPGVCVNLQPHLEKEVYDRHIQCLNAPFVFNLLCNLEYESSEVLEDSSRLPSALIYRPIRQRCYGVLFNYFSQNYSNKTKTKDGRPIIIKEWVAYKGNSMEKPEYVQPIHIKPSCHLKDFSLNIERLWFQSSDVEKFAVFWSIMGIPMEFDMLLSLPKQYIVLACILNYLIDCLGSGEAVTPIGVAVLIAQALWKKSVTELNELKVPWVDASAVNLSTLFMRGVTTALMILNVSGNPFPTTFAMPWHFFDGKLFHYLYVKAKEAPYIHIICNKESEMIKEFGKLLQVVTRNTSYSPDRFNWNYVLKDFDVVR